MPSKHICTFRRIVIWAHLVIFFLISPLNAYSDPNISGSEPTDNTALAWDECEFSDGLEISQEGRRAARLAYTKLKAIDTQQQWGYPPSDVVLEDIAVTNYETLVALKNRLVCERIRKKDLDQNNGTGLSSLGALLAWGIFDPILVIAATTRNAAHGVGFVSKPYEAPRDREEMLTTAVATLNKQIRTRTVMFKDFREKNPVRYGTCEVTVLPSDEVVSKMRLSTIQHIPSYVRNENEELSSRQVNWFFRDPSKGVVVTQTATTDFFEQFASRVNGSKAAHAMIFVHGHDTTLEEACRIVATMAEATKFHGLALLFRWPTTESYGHDLDWVHLSALELKALIWWIKGRHNNVHIHAVAHSLGNQVLLGALIIERFSPVGQRHSVLLDNLVLLAPDVDHEQFCHHYADSMDLVAGHATIFASDRDWALGLSNWGRRGEKKRLGQPGEHLRLLYDKPHIDIIDATKVNTSILGHDLHSQPKVQAIIRDLFHGIKAMNRIDLIPKDGHMNVFEFIN